MFSLQQGSLKWKLSLIFIVLPLQQFLSKTMIGVLPSTLQERPNHKIWFISLSSFDLPGGGQEETFCFLLDFNLGISELSQLIEADPCEAAAECFRERSEASIIGWGWNSSLVRNASVNILIRVAFAAEWLLRWELQLSQVVQGCQDSLEHSTLSKLFLLSSGTQADGNWLFNNTTTLSSTTKCQDWFGLYCHAVFQKINCYLW